MSDISSFDPQTLAQQMATYNVLALQTALQKQTTTLKSQQSALDALRTALNDFRSVLTGLNKTNDGMLQNKASQNQEGIANITVNDSAQKGTYNLDVEQLASAQQLGYEGLSDEDIKNASGKMTITLGQGSQASTITVDMDKVNSLSELTKAINGHADNPGVTASLVRTDGNVTLMLSSDESGAQNTISVTSDTAGLFDQATEISKAQDAKFRMGSMTFTSSSNTLDKLIEGVTIELQGTTEANKPLTITIGTDTEGTKERLQSFIDGYNALRTELNKLTASGGSEEGRGALAGDATMASLENELNAMLRTAFNGKRITDFGITADRDGKLELDGEKLEEQLKADPQALSKLFNDKDGLLKKLDKSLDRYLNNSTGLLKGRKEMLDRQQSTLDSKSDMINTRYDAAYNRYLTQFTQLQQVMTQMNNTMSMFDLV